jgi:hypothetical protein
VSIINTNGLVLFGPGSEWLWTFAQFAALSLTGYAIYRQLRAQGSANAVEAQASLNAQWDSERQVRARLSILMHFAAGKPGWPPLLNEVANLLESIATLQNHGHLRLDDTWEEWSSALQVWWALCGPLIVSDRASNPTAFTAWEKLAARMAALDRERHGWTLDVSPESAAMYIGNTIPKLIARLELEREIKGGLVPAWPPQAEPVAT